MNRYIPSGYLCKATDSTSLSTYPHIRTCLICPQLTFIYSQLTLLELSAIVEHDRQPSGHTDLSRAGGALLELLGFKEDCA